MQQIGICKIVVAWHFLNVWNLQNGKCNLLSNCKKKVTGGPFKHQRWWWRVFCCPQLFATISHTRFAMELFMAYVKSELAFDVIHNAPLSFQQVLCSKHYCEFGMNLAWILGIQELMLCQLMCTMVCSISAKIDIRDFVSHADAWHMGMPRAFDILIMIFGFEWNHECGRRTTATVVLFLHAAYCGSVTIIRASDEASDVLFKRVKAKAVVRFLTAFCWWKKYSAFNYFRWQ